MYTFGLLISIWKIPTHYIIYNEYPTAWYNIAHDIDHIQNLFTLDEKALCQVFIALLLYRYVMFRSTNFKRFFTAEKFTRTAPKMVCVSLAIWFYIYSVFFFPPLRGHGGEVVWVWVFWGLQNRVSAEQLRLPFVYLLYSGSLNGLRSALCTFVRGVTPRGRSIICAANNQVMQKCVHFVQSKQTGDIFKDRLS